jgi:hypothetical protein
MLASGGVWLESASDAEQIYGKEIITAAALRKERSKGECPLWKTLSRAMCNGRPINVPVQGTCRRAMFMREIADPQGWLEGKLGEMLLCFAFEEDADE